MNALLRAATTVLESLALYSRPHDSRHVEVLASDWDAALLLARACRDEYDATPITDEWLRPLCVDVLGLYYLIHSLNNTEDVYVVRWSGGWRLAIGGYTVQNSATRGDVRRLCRAVNIELKEST